MAFLPPRLALDRAPFPEEEEIDPITGQPVRSPAFAPPRLVPRLPLDTLPAQPPPLTPEPEAPDAYSPSPDYRGLYAPGGPLEQFAGQGMEPLTGWQQKERRRLSPYQPEPEAPLLPGFSPATAEELAEGADAVGRLGAGLGTLGRQAVREAASGVLPFLPPPPEDERPLQSMGEELLTPEYRPPNPNDPLDFLNAFPAVAGPALAVTRANPAMKALLEVAGQEVREVGPQAAQAVRAAPRLLREVAESEVGAIGPLRGAGDEATEAAAAGKAATSPGGELAAEGQLSLPGMPLSEAEVHAAADAGVSLPPPGGETQFREALRERGFAEHLRTSQATGQALRQSLTERTEQYARLANKTSWAAGERLVTEDPDAARALVMDGQGEPSAVTVMTGINLIKQAEQAGDVVEADALARTLAKRLTAAGQMVQAASAWEKFSPEGVLVYANLLLRDAVAKHGESAVVKRLATMERETLVATAREQAATARAEASAISKLAQELGKLAPNPKSEASLTAAESRLTGLAAQAEKLVAQEPTFGDIAAAARQLAQEMAQLRQFLIVQGAAPQPDDLRKAARAFERSEREQERRLLDPRRVERAEAAEEARATRAQEQEERQAFREAETAQQRQERESWEALNREIRQQAQERTAQERATTAFERAEGREEAREARALEREAQKLEAAIRKEEAARLRAEQRAAQDFAKFQARQEQQAFRAAEKERKQAEREAWKALDKEIRRQVTAFNRRERDLKALTDQATRLVQRRALTAEREAIKSAKQRLRAAGVELPEVLARSFLDRAQALNALPPNSIERVRAQQALLADVMKVAPPNRWRQFLDTINVPRSLQSGFDLSWPLRQGMMGVGHPREWTGAVKAMVQSFGDGRVADAVDQTLLFGPLGRARKQAGLQYVDRYGPLSQAEEAFLSRAVGRIPLRIGRIYQASERAFTTAGNKFRGDVFNSTVLGWLPEQYRTPEWLTTATLGDLVQVTGRPEQDFTELARFLNAITGRSDIGLLKSNAALLNGLFWAPRYTLSRFEAPSMAVFTSSPAVRRLVWKDLLAFTSAVLAPLALIKLAGGEVEMDPRSNDFLKAQIAGLRLDFTAGLGLTIRTVVQMAAGQQKTSAGRIKDLNRGDVLLHYLRQKLAPAPGLATDVATGSDILGRPVQTPGQIGLALAQRVLPLGPRDIADASREAGALGGVVAAPLVTLGVGVQAYSTLDDARQVAARRMFPGKPWASLSETQRDQVNAQPEVQAKAQEMAGRVGLDVETRLQAAFQFSRDDRARREGELLQLLTGPTPVSGETLREAIQSFKEANFNVARALFTPELEAARVRGVDLPVQDQLRQAYWSAPVPRDRQGQLDFRARDRTRTQVLEQADRLGVSRKNVQDRGFLAQDPKLRAALEAYERDMETLRPYWEVRDQIAQELPAYAEAHARIPSLPLGSLERELLEEDYAYRLGEAKVAYEREWLRRQFDNGIDEAGARWGYWKPLHTSGVPLRPMRPFIEPRPSRPSRRR